MRSCSCNIKFLARLIVSRCLPDSPKLGLGLGVRVVGESGFGESGLNLSVDVFVMCVSVYPQL